MRAAIVMWTWVGGFVGSASAMAQADTRAVSSDSLSVVVQEDLSLIHI